MLWPCWRKICTKACSNLLLTVTSHDRPERPHVNRDTHHELRRGPNGRRFSNERHLGCVFQDMKPRSLFFGRAQTWTVQSNVWNSRRLLRVTQIRDQNPMLEYICPGEPHQRSPNAPKFEDRSQEETEWQEEDAREAAWKRAKDVVN